MIVGLIVEYIRTQDGSSKMKEIPEHASAQMRMFRKTLELRTLLGDNIEQRTSPWYERRGYNVGGSQAGNLIPSRESHSQTSNAILKLAISMSQARVSARERRRCAKKMRPPPLSSWWSVPTMWGTIIEPYSDELVARLGSVGTPEQTMQTCGSILARPPGVAFSPDGVGIIDWEYWRRFAPAPESIPDDVAITLLEYKNPYSTALPDKPQWGYEMQIRAGLEVIPVSAGMLLQTMWRMCPVRALTYPHEFSRTEKMLELPPASPADDSRRVKTRCETLFCSDRPALAWTCIVFRVRSELMHPDAGTSPLGGEYVMKKTEESRRKAGRQCLRDFRRISRKYPVQIPSGLPEKGPALKECAGVTCDLGSAPDKVFREVLWMFNQGMLDLEYTPVRFYEDSVDILGEPSKSTTLPGAPSGRPVAVLPIKLFELRTHYVEPDRRGIVKKMSKRALAALKCARVLAEYGYEHAAEYADSLARDV